MGDAIDGRRIHGAQLGREKKETVFAYLCFGREKGNDTEKREEEAWNWGIVAQSLSLSFQCFSLFLCLMLMRTLKSPYHTITIHYRIA